LSAGFPSLSSGGRSLKPPRIPSQTRRIGSDFVECSEELHSDSDRPPRRSRPAAPAGHIEKLMLVVEQPTAPLCQTAGAGTRSLSAPVWRPNFSGQMRNFARVHAPRQPPQSGSRCDSYWGSGQARGGCNEMRYSPRIYSPRIRHPQGAGGGRPACGPR
jgi:hypothetical protein